jgi:hypothetical protein
MIAFLHALVDGFDEAADGSLIGKVPVSQGRTSRKSGCGVPPQSEESKREFGESRES